MIQTIFIASNVAIVAALRLFLALNQINDEKMLIKPSRAIVFMCKLKESMKDFIETHLNKNTNDKQHRQLSRVEIINHITIHGARRAHILTQSNNNAEQSNSK